MSTHIGGTCDSRFAAVRQAFAGNFAERDEIGAAVCVSVDGLVVVDLWGGHADAGRRVPWEADTLVNVFSVGKGMLAVVVAGLAGRGLLDVDDRVVSVWPGYGSVGKERTTIRHLLSHQAGMPALHDRLPPDAMFDWSAMAEALAAGQPWWEPGTAHGYHVNTFGFLAGEVARRATGASPGELLRRVVTGPLGADVHLGVGVADLARVAEFVWPGETPADEPPALAGSELMRHNAYFNPSGLSGVGIVNTTRWRAAEMPSTNVHASARGVARVFAAVVAGGTLDGVAVVDRAALADACTEQVDGDDLILGRRTRFGLGFQLTQPERPLGPNPSAFGHFGAGGSLGFCDPDSGVAFGYVHNRPDRGWQNSRNRALVDAVFDALGD